MLGAQSRWAESGMSKCFAIDSRTAQIVILLLGAGLTHPYSSRQSLPRIGKCHDLLVVSIEIELTTLDHCNCNVSHNTGAVDEAWGHNFRGYEDDTSARNEIGHR